VFLSSRISQAAYCFFTPVGILWTMNADGSDQHRISANYLNDFTPAVMNDGRIIYGRWEYVDRPAIPIQSLWTIHADGTMLKGFFGNRVLDPASFIEPQPIPGSRAVLCTLTGHNGSCRGAIGIIDPDYGQQCSGGHPEHHAGDPSARGHAQHQRASGPYQTPYPLDQRYYLVSYDGTLLVRDYDCTQQATVLEPREGWASTIRGRCAAGRARRCAAANVGRSRRRRREHGDAVPAGRLQRPGAARERGEVKQIAVVQEVTRALISSPGIHRPLYDFQRMLVSCGATYVPKQVLGFADVAEDGSACFRVPPMQPLYFIALDAEGRAVQRMRSFTHLMPGEVQGCIGCHESRHDGPRPLLPAVLAREPQELVRRSGACAASATPRSSNPCSTSIASAATTPANPTAWTCRATAPTASTCPTKCWPTSGRDGPAARTSTGSPRTTATNGTSRRSRPSSGARIPASWPTWCSPAIRIRTGSHASPQRAERRRILMWIDLNVPYYGTADTAHPDSAGLPADVSRRTDRT
jgi:hypothetical protein